MQNDEDTPSTYLTNTLEVTWTGGWAGGFPISVVSARRGGSCIGLVEQRRPPLRGGRIFFFGGQHINV